MTAHPLWSDQELETLRAMAAQGDDARTISNVIRRSCDSVQVKARKLGVAITKANPKRSARQRSNLVSS